MATQLKDDPVVIVPAALIAWGLDLVSFPVVHLARDRRGFVFLAFNAAFVDSGLGIQAPTSPLIAALGDRIDAFLASDALRIEFDWTIGAVVDCRYYRVTIARSAVAVADRCVLILLDRTSQHHTERSLRREMTTDSLTGLPNREGLAEIIEAAHAEGRDHAVLIVDLDRFGRFNACLGSLAGDELLITVARRIKGALRARDTLARVGGNEFGILFVIDHHADEASHLAERIHAVLQAPFRLTDYELSVECSIGIAFRGEGEEAVVDLIRHAKFAARRARSTDRTEIYRSQTLTAARARFTMETALRRAIERGELRLGYQPIRDLATGRVVSFEALARWTDADGQRHSPADFIPVAEESGLIVPLGRWALDTAASTLSRWDAARGRDCGVRMAVNLSAIQLQRDDIPARVAETLSRHGLRGERLTLELTESVIVADPERVAGVLHALKALGPTLAMDDFGTGYSNLAFLQQLPIDVLKIDRSFVTGMLEDADQHAIVRAVLSLAAALGMRTTAEGIETHAVGDALAAMGCTYGQGYAYAPALEPEAAFALIA